MAGAEWCVYAPVHGNGMELHPGFGFVLARGSLPLYQIGSDGIKYVVVK